MLERQAAAGPDLRLESGGRAMAIPVGTSFRGPGARVMVPLTAGTQIEAGGMRGSPLGQRQVLPLQGTRRSEPLEPFRFTAAAPPAGFGAAPACRHDGQRHRRRSRISGLPARVSIPE